MAVPPPWAIEQRTICSVPDGLCTFVHLYRCIVVPPYLPGLLLTDKQTEQNSWHLQLSVSIAQRTSSDLEQPITSGFCPTNRLNEKQVLLQTDSVLTVLTVPQDFPTESQTKQVLSQTSSILIYPLYLPHRRTDTPYPYDCPRTIERSPVKKLFDPISSNQAIQYLN